MANPLSRRDFLKLGALGVVGAGGATAIAQTNKNKPRQSMPPCRVWIMATVPYQEPGMSTMKITEWFL